MREIIIYPDGSVHCDRRFMYAKDAQAILQSFGVVQEKVGRFGDLEKPKVVRRPGVVLKIWPVPEPGLYERIERAIRRSSNHKQRRQFYEKRNADIREHYKRLQAKGNSTLEALFALAEMHALSVLSVRRIIDGSAHKYKPKPRGVQ